MRKELLERCGKIRLVEDNESQKARLNCDLRRSISIASGSSVVELKIKAPTWVGQVRIHYFSKVLNFDLFLALELLGIRSLAEN